MKCSFDNCCWEARVSIGNNINGGSIPLCNKCLKKYETHLKAREINCEQKGRQQREKEILKIIDNTTYDKTAYDVLVELKKAIKNEDNNTRS